MIDEKKLVECLRHDISCFKINNMKDNEMYVRVDDMIRMIEGQLKVGDWIPCSERLPENEKEVEITFIRKHCITGKTLYLTARAFYEDGTVTTDESVFCWYTENLDYDEEKDCYVIPEGWFEGVSFAEEFESVDMPVIAWREITEPYRPAREV